MRSWTATFLKLIWGAYLVLTSIYCLLAFLPYTYFALIKSPAYAWMPWFAHHHGLLYWPALLAAFTANRMEKNEAQPNRPLRTTGLGGNRPRNLAFHAYATE